MGTQQHPIYALKAEFFRVLGHPTRVRILELLNDGVQTVGELSGGPWVELERDVATSRGAPSHRRGRGHARRSERAVSRARPANAGDARVGARDGDVDHRGLPDDARRACRERAPPRQAPGKRRTGSKRLMGTPSDHVEAVWRVVLVDRGSASSSSNVDMGRWSLMVGHSTILPSTERIARTTRSCDITKPTASGCAAQ